MPLKQLTLNAGLVDRGHEVLRGHVRLGGEERKEVIGEDSTVGGDGDVADGAAGGEAVGLCCKEK